MEFFTIGVYHSSEEDFFRKLLQNKINTFCDIRQRRGIRGSKYTFVNSKKLQHKLAELGINYMYVKGLAPGPKIREIQKKIDSKNKRLKKNRQTLDDIFIKEYNNQVLNIFNFDNFIEELNLSGESRIVFFCVEEFSEACHRSLVTKRITEQYKYNIKHI
jgi:hypothetical protein